MGSTLKRILFRCSKSEKQCFIFSLTVFRFFRQVELPRRTSNLRRKKTSRTSLPITTSPNQNIHLTPPKRHPYQPNQNQPSRKGKKKQGKETKIQQGRINIELRGAPSKRINIRQKATIHKHTAPKPFYSDNVSFPGNNL